MEKKKKDQLANKKIYEEDISYSESLDIYKIISYEDKTWSCTCPYWTTYKKECLHIKHYKEYHFDPAFITDNADCYRRFDDYDLVKMGKSGYKFKNFIDDFPRWGIEYILHWNLKHGYSKRSIAESLKISEYKLNKLFKLLNEYREQEQLKLHNYITLFVQDNRVTDFSMRSSNLKSLPESIGNYTNVKSIDFTSNWLEELPESFGDLPLLEKLILNDNILKKLPISIGNLSNLRELELIESRLMEFPVTFGNLSRLEKLIASYNKLIVLPDSFGKLKSLKILDLKRNYLKMLPESFGNLKNLITLDLSENELTSLPESFGDLKQLEVLNLSSNNLKRIAESFGKLTSLKYINLNKTNITTLPETFSNLKSLESIFLGYGCTLEYLPNSVKELIRTIEKRSGKEIIDPFIWNKIEGKS